jgi:capsular polysaccharide export protein
VEYAHAAGRFLRKPIAKQRLSHLVKRCTSRSQPYYLFPLQLNADVQIRHHFSPGRMEPAIEQVIASFARCAPKNIDLVLTEHPLETGVIDLKRFARRCGEAHGIGSRLRCLEGGSPRELVAGCRGMITVNSTMGPVAMGFGVPLIALGRALYAMPGLTFQGALDDFWHDAAPADPDLFDAFRRVVAARTQIAGGFYSASAIELAVQGATRRLEHDAAHAAPVQRAPQPHEAGFGFANGLHPITS